MTRGYLGSTTPVEDRDLWQTPQFVFDYYDKVVGRNYDLDVCASPHNAKCGRFYTESDNGLLQPWGERNWCNPPYSETGKWVDVAIAYAHLGGTTDMLVPSDTSTEWFYKLFNACEEIDIIKGRIQFDASTEGRKANGNNKGSLLCRVTPQGVSDMWEVRVNILDRNTMKQLAEIFNVPT